MSVHRPGVCHLAFCHEGGWSWMARTSKKPKKRWIVGGVGTHAGTHHAVVEVMNGGGVADALFPAAREGYGQLLGWMRSGGCRLSGSRAAALTVWVWSATCATKASR